MRSRNQLNKHGMDALFVTNSQFPNDIDACHLDASNSAADGASVILQTDRQFQFY
jgi:hypothetical protein